MHISRLKQCLPRLPHPSPTVWVQDPLLHTLLLPTTHTPPFLPVRPPPLSSPPVRRSRSEFKALLRGSHNVSMEPDGELELMVYMRLQLTKPEARERRRGQSSWDGGGINGRQVQAIVPASPPPLLIHSLSPACQWLKPPCLSTVPQCLSPSPCLLPAHTGAHRQGGPHRRPAQPGAGGQEQCVRAVQHHAAARCRHHPADTWGVLGEREGGRGGQAEERRVGWLCFLFEVEEERVLGEWEEGGTPDREGGENAWSGWDVGGRRRRRGGEGREGRGGKYRYCWALVVPCTLLLA